VSDKETDPARERTDPRRQGAMNAAGIAQEISPLQAALHRNKPVSNNLQSVDGGALDDAPSSCSYQLLTTVILSFGPLKRRPLF
jgi:hypothetical protein